MTPVVFVFSADRLQDVDVQNGTVVIEFKRTFMVYKRGHVPVRL